MHPETDAVHQNETNIVEMEKLLLCVGERAFLCPESQSGNFPPQKPAKIPHKHKQKITLLIQTTSVYDF